MEKVAKGMARKLGMEVKEVRGNYFALTNGEAVVEIHKVEGSVNSENRIHVEYTTDTFYRFKDVDTIFEAEEFISNVSA